MQNINVNIVPDSYPQTIRYSQGDVGREFKINVVGFTIPTGATVKIQATKPSGFGFSVAGTVADNAVSFTTTAIMTDEAGRFPAELEITKDSVVIGTANFIMWGEANPHPEGTTDGQQGTIIPELTLLVERVEAAASSILDMEVVANTLPAGSQATYSYDEDLNKATFGIPQGEAGAGAAGVVADAYSSSKTYKVGDYVLHNSNLYRCTTAITTAEAFTAAHWTQIVLANDVSDLKTDLDEYADIFTADVSESVSNWLDEHPEATTTVEDGSLTLPKFKEGELPFVTPEQFGAKGDGVTDDTAAWQSAVDSGYSVRAMSPAYKCGQIVVTKNITIDCNGATFNCTASKLFYCKGEVVATLTSESDYTANQSDYSITNLEYSDYTGIAMLKGTNNYEKSRDYYRGGFVCEFYNGKIVGTYPINVTGVSIEIIKPIKVEICNIGDIDHSVSSEDYTIMFEYGYGCVIKNCNISHSGAYVVIMLYNCLNCICENCNITQEYTSNDNNSYLISWSNSSFCSAVNCYMYNKNWHCITTGNTYLCYHNYVDNCMLYTSGSVAFEDHENALNSIVQNSVVAGIGLSGMGVVENCRLISNQDNYKSCRIRIIAMSNKDNAIYTINNVVFLPDSTANTYYIGVVFTSSSRVSSNTYYIKQCNLKNVKCENNAIACRFDFGFSKTSTNIVENIFIDNTNFFVGLGTYIGDNHIDISNYVLTMQNCLSIEYDTYYPYLGESKDFIFNTLHLKNCKLGRLRGTFTYAYLVDVEIVNTVYGTDFIVTGELFGSNIRGAFTSGVTTNPSKLRITDFQNAGTMMFNLMGTVRKYGQYYNSDGTITTEQLSM